MRFRNVLLVSLLLMGLASVGSAQEDRGRISGLVTDPTGAVVPRAKVTLTNIETNVTQTTVSDGAGDYVFGLLNPGVYSLQVVAPGFASFRVQNIHVNVASQVGVNVKLTVGESTKTVTVRAGRVAELDTQDASLGFTVGARSATDLPILYGNPFELQLLSPAVISTSLSTGNHTYEGGSESTTVNGAQSARTEFTLDGAPDTRNGGDVTTAYIPSRDFIGQFRLITSPYDASMSHTSGASLDTSIRSGTSKFHGNLDEFYQDPNADAPQFSQGPSVAPALMYHRESGDLGGPIIPRKLFFFAGYEHQYNRQASSTTTQTVPTVAEKQGDFSALLGLGKTQTAEYTCPSTGQTLTSAPFNQYQIFDPFTTAPDPNCPGLYLRQPVPGNIITSMDPVAKKILSYYPNPTGSASETPNGESNFVSNAANVDRYWDVLTRIDYTINDRQKMFGHFLISHRIQPGKEAYFPGASGKNNLLKNKGAVVDYVNAINDTTLLNLRYSLTRFYTSETSTAMTTATQLGINANATAGVPAVASGFPTVSVTGYAELGNVDPSFEADTIHDAQINLSKNIGRHQLRMGAEWRIYEADLANYSDEKLYIQSTGEYAQGPSSSLSSSPIGQALAEFEYGITEGTTAAIDAQTANDTTYWAGYLQDDWKAAPKLTVNLGLRYEYFGALNERHGKSITGFDTAVQNPIAPQAIANYAGSATPTELALVPAADFHVLGGVHFEQPGQPLWHAQRGNLSPRFGFAYNPCTRLVLRGGFGIFYQHIGELLPYANPLGFTQTTQTVPTLNNGQTFIATLQNPFPDGLVQPSGNSYGLLQNVGQAIDGFFVQNPKSPITYHFSLGFQYALPGQIVLEADYVGALARHLIISRDYDAVPDRYLSTSPVRDAAMNAINGELSASYPNPFEGIAVPGSSSLTGTTISGSQLVKPYPEFTDLTAEDPAGISNYNGLQVRLQKRFSHGYNMSVAYSWSRTLDALQFLNPGDAKPWYGTSNGDYPQVLSIAGIYELPFGRNRLFLNSLPRWQNELIGGFQVEGTYRIQSGQPLSFDDAGSVLAPGAKLSDINGPSLHNYKQWFNTHAFDNYADATAAGINYANSEALVSNLRTLPLRFNNVRQDYQNLLNVGAMKKFTADSERVRMDLRAEAINALNHQVYSAPNTDPASSSFGEIGGPGNSSRQLQFAFELRF